jgi:hypothetical protein
MMAFLSGMEATGYLVAALMFLRFWRKMRDPLFLWFSGSFGLFAIGQVFLTWLGEGSQEGGAAFIPRLLGFVLLAVAILAKNL